MSNILPEASQKRGCPRSVMMRLRHVAGAARRAFSSREECATRLETVKGKQHMKPLKTKQKGVDILHDPLWNKGMVLFFPGVLGDGWMSIDVA